MQVTYTKISNIEEQVLVEIPAEDFDLYVEKAAGELSKGFEVEGFRKGHVPRDIVERRLGSSRLYSEAGEIAAQATFSKALNEDKETKERIKLLPRRSVSNIQVMKLAPGNPFVYRVVLHIPSFELFDGYKDVAVKACAKEKESSGSRLLVDEKEVEETLKWLKKSRREKDGKEEAVINDDFAKKLGNFENLEQLKSSIREGLSSEKKKKEKDRVRMLVVKEIVDRSKREIPEEVVSAEIGRIEEESKHNIEDMGVDFETYLTKINKKKEELREGWRDQTRERVETELALDAIAAREHIEPDEQTITAEAQEILKRYKTIKDAEKHIDPARLREYVHGILKNEKTFEFLENL